MREGPAGKEKSRALDSGTAPLKRDLQLIAVPYSLFVSFIIRDQVELFNIKMFSALSRRRRSSLKIPPEAADLRVMKGPR
jgi:hypothetical protein